MLISHLPANLFVQERTRLLSALGEIVDGGIVELIEHIGATSMDDAVGEPIIDIALSIWPFPIDAEHQTILNALGYEPISSDEGSAPQRFRHAAAPFQLFFFEAGSASWSDYHITSEYLHQDKAARLTYLQHKQAWAANSRGNSHEHEVAKRQFFLGLRGEARRWWIAQQGWTPVEFARDALKDFTRPWYIASGWALDLYLDRVRRVHEDVDVVIAWGDQLELQEHMSARGWRWVAPANGRMEPWPAQLYLEPPRHQVHAYHDGAFIDFLLTEMDSNVWHYRRDRNVVRAAERAHPSSRSGIPYLAPELVLLFKSKNTSGRERDKDETDFQEVFPHLEPERRAWLYWALAATQPEHPWLKQYQSTTQ